MMILNKDRWPARRWYIPGVKSDAINKDDLSICWQESLPPPLDIMRALQIFLFSSFGSHFFHHMFKNDISSKLGLVSDMISCQWHQRVSGPKAKGLLLNIFVTMINPIHHNQWPQSSGLKQKRKAVRPEASETAARISSSVGLSSSSPFYLFLSSEDKTPSALTRESYLWRNGWQSWSHPMLHHVSSVTVTRAHPSHNSPFIVASSLSS